MRAEFNKTMLEHLRQNTPELHLAHWEDSSITVKADERDCSESLQPVFHDFSKDTFYQNDLNHYVHSQYEFFMNLLNKLPDSPAYSDLVNLKMSYLYNNDRSKLISARDLMWALTNMGVHCGFRDQVVEAWNSEVALRRRLDDETCKALISQNALRLIYMPAYFKDSRIVFEAVKQNWLVYALLPFQLRNNKALLIEALKQDPRAFFYGPRDLRIQMPNPVSIMINSLL